MQITILDGGMGRELARRKAPFQQPEWSALALYQQPSAVQAVHEDFIQSGAQIITTNSYAVVPFHIGETRFHADGKSLADLAGRLAKNAVAKQQQAVQIAGSLPPLFGSYRFDLFEPQRVAEVAQPIIDGLAPYVDFWLCETQSNSAEPMAIKPLLPQDGRPLWVSFTLQDEEASDIPRLRSGETVADAVAKMVDLGVAAILFNCSQPEVMAQAITTANATLQAKGVTNIHLGAYANAFPPQPKDATANDGLDEIREDLNPEQYLAWAQQWIAAGASIVGGCCGIGPEHIARLAQAFK